MTTDTATSPSNLTRAELHALVWQTPMNQLAKRFGRSDQGLAKICERHAVPRPPQGHWNKLAAGKPTKAIALPPCPAGVADTIILRPTPQDPQQAAASAQIETTKAQLPAISVAERLHNPHPVIATWIARRDKEIAKREKVYDHRLRRLAAPSPFSAMERRRNRALNAILKGLEAQGVATIESEQRGLVATKGRERIELQLRIKHQQTRRPLTPDEQRWRYASDNDYKIELVETDVLIFEVKTYLPRGLPRLWQDGRKGTVEELAGDIVATLVAAFPLMVTEREQREEAERIRHDAERRRHDEARRLKLERDRFRRFLEHAQRWKEAALAREFIVALQHGPLPKDVTVDGIDADAWIAWVEQRIAEHSLAGTDPIGIFESVASVTSYSYRD